MIAVAVRLMRLTRWSSCMRRYVTRYFRCIWTQSHPLELPLMPLLLEGHAAEVLRRLIASIRKDLTC